MPYFTYHPGPNQPGGQFLLRGVSFPVGVPVEVNDVLAKKLRGMKSFKEEGAAPKGEMWVKLDGPVSKPEPEPETKPAAKAVAPKEAAKPKKRGRGKSRKGVTDGNTNEG